MEIVTIGTLPHEVERADLHSGGAEVFHAIMVPGFTIKDYDTGVAAADALNKGKSILHLRPSLLLWGNRSRKRRFSTSQPLQKSNALIIGRTDHGIKTFTDLKGKKVGVPRKTIAEFYFGRFLELNGMSMTEITIVDLLPSQLQDALAHGKVDAVIAWQPWASQIEKAGAEW